MTLNNTQKFLAGTIALVLAIGMTNPAFAAENGLTADIDPSAIAADAVTPDGTWFEFGFTTAAVILHKSNALPWAVDDSSNTGIPSDYRVNTRRDHSNRRRKNRLGKS